jgi:hypothetical protein
VKLCAGKWMRALAFIDGVTAAILHPEQLVLALVEFMIADRGNFESHHRQGFDRGFIVKHRRQKRAGADQVTGCDENRVLVAFAELLDQGCHVLGTAGRNSDPFGFVVGVGDPNPARRRPKVAVEIVDGENS